MKPALVTWIALCCVALVAPACKRGPKVVVMTEEQAKALEGESVRPSHKSEEVLRQEYEERKRARENAPEPELNPDDPREKFELIWRMGKRQMNSIYQERFEMIALMKRMKFKDKAEGKTIGQWRDKLQQFGIGKRPATMEKAPLALCKLITEVRVPAEKLIAKGEVPLRELQKRTEAYDMRAAARTAACETACTGYGRSGAVASLKWAKAFHAAGRKTRESCISSGGEREVCTENGLTTCTASCDDSAKDKHVGPPVYQKEWDKLEGERARWSQPVKGGKYLLMIVKSILDEALVLAEYGPRRAQIALRDCLTVVAKEPLPFDLAQTQLEKVIARSKWYRDLR